VNKISIKMFECRVCEVVPYMNPPPPSHVFSSHCFNYCCTCERDYLTLFLDSTYINLGSMQLHPIKDNQIDIRLEFFHFFSFFSHNIKINFHYIYIYIYITFILILINIYFKLQFTNLLMYHF